MSREDLFNKAKADRKDQKIQEANKKPYTPYTYEEKMFAPLEQGRAKAFRVVGNPLTQRDGDPTSPKKILFSKILGDDGKMFNCNWEDGATANNWIMRRLMNKILKYNVDGESRTYIYEKSHPELFNRVAYNNKPESSRSKFEKGWRFGSVLLMNVIDRNQMDTHMEKKHTAILSKNVWEAKDGTFRFEDGAPISVYTALWDEVVEIEGDFNNYDIVIEKLSEKPYYKVYHSVEDYRKIGLKMFPDKDIHDNQLLPLATQPLTPEELSWERYDFDKLYKVTSYRKLLKKLSVFIAQVDAVFKTDFLGELTKLAEQEKIEMDAKKESEPKAEPVQEVAPVPVAPVTPARVDEKYADAPFETPATPVATPTVRPTRTRTETVAQPTKKESLLDAGYMVENYSDSELALIEGINGDGDIMWKEGYGLLDCNDPTCAYPAPQEVSSCIKCGKTF